MFWFGERGVAALVIVNFVLQLFDRLATWVGLRASPRLGG